jgi:hypothetical protein
LVPHGHGDAELFEAHPGAFVRDRKGAALGGGYLGRFVVDPTSEEGASQLRRVAGEMSTKGYRVLRLGGLRHALRFYGLHRDRLAGAALDPLAVLEESLRILRDAGGEDTVLCGDGDTPREALRWLDAAPPRWDELAGLVGPEPLQQERAGAALDLRFHRHAWWLESLPVGRWAAAGGAAERRRAARSRMSFASLTGRGLLIDAGSPPTPLEEAALRRAAPLAGAVPLDLFQRREVPAVWDLKVGGTSASQPYDVVGLFHAQGALARTLTLGRRQLALSADGLRAGGAAAVEEAASWIVFDLWAERVTARGRLPLDFLLLAGSSRLVAVHRELERPQVVGVAGGPLLGQPLVLTGVTWDGDRGELSGAAALESRELRIHVLCPLRYRAREARADGAAAHFLSRGEQVVLFLERERTSTRQSGRRVPWRVAFERAPRASPAPASLKLGVTFDPRNRRPLLRWRPETREGEDMPAGRFVVMRDGKRIGLTADCQFLDRDASWGATYRYEVRRTRDDARQPDSGSEDSGGTEDKEHTEHTEHSGGSPTGRDRGEESAHKSLRAVSRFRVPAAADSYLSAWAPVRVGGSSPPPARDRSATGGPLAIRGQRWQDGIGVRAPSRLDFDLRGAYDRFEARAGVDDAARFAGSVVFVVLGDGEELYRSPRVTGSDLAPLEIAAGIAGVETLTLSVEDAGDGNEKDLADWGAPRVLVGREDPGRSER